MKFKKISSLFILCLTLLIAGSLLAQDTTKTKESSQMEKKFQGQDKQNQRFVDEDGDGYNDNAPDHDGDGIPNGLDPDWQKLRAGKGKKGPHRYIDLDGDGINDYMESGTDNEKTQGDQLNQQKDGSSMDSKSKQESAQQRKRQRHKE